MIIIFNGPPGSGKDLCCEYLKSKGFVHIEFKKVLYTETIKHFNVDEKWFFDGYTRKQKEVKEELLNGMSRREAMIYMSENVLKPLHGKGFFGLESSKIMDIDKHYCISDGGFVEEIYEIINKFGADKVCVVRLYREGSNFKKDSRKYVKVNIHKEYISGFASCENDYLDQFFESKIDVDGVAIHNNGDQDSLFSILESILQGMKIND